MDLATASAAATTDAAGDSEHSVSSSSFSSFSSSAETVAMAAATASTPPLGGGEKKNPSVTSTISGKVKDSKSSSGAAPLLRVEHLTEMLRTIAAARQPRAAEELYCRLFLMQQEQGEEHAEQGEEQEQEQKKQLQQQLEQSLFHSSHLLPLTHAVSSISHSFFFVFIAQTKSFATNWCSTFTDFNQPIS